MSVSLYILMLSGILKQILQSIEMNGICTSSKLTIETLEYKVWNMFKVNGKDTRTMPMASF